MRVPEDVIDSVIYLYPNCEAAYKGERAGGSGCLVGVQTSCLSDLFHVYAVTNRHIIESGSPVVRVNSKSGDIDAFPLKVSDWKTHPDGEDVAVCELSPSWDKHDFNFLIVSDLDSVSNPFQESEHKGCFLTQQEITNWGIGPGTETFLVGRFSGHEGHERNRPSARFGRISMMPGDAIRQDNGHLQVGFLVEMHSISGYSGSPVFVYVNRNLPGTGPLGSYEWSMWFMGIDWGHLYTHEHILDRSGDPHPQGWRVRINSGMVGVVPAWMIRDLLYDEELIATRKAEDAKLLIEKPVTAAFDANKAK